MRSSRATAVFTITAAATFAALNGAAAWLDTRMPQQVTYIGPDAQRLVEGMDLLADLEVASDVVFVGTSMTGFAVDTSVVEEASPAVDTANNVALPAAQTTVIERWLLEEVIPRLDPGLVVWGVSTLDFNGNRAQRTDELYDRALSTRPGWLGAGDRLLAEHVALSRRRDELRDPAVVIDAVLDPAERTTPRLRPADAANYVPLYLTREQILAAPGIAELLEERGTGLEDNALKDFVIGDAEVVAFERTLDTLRDRGLPVVVVLMPTSSEYRAAHPGGADEFSDAIATIAALAEARDVHLVDLTTSFDDDAFFDATHLAPASRRDVSLMLAEELEGLRSRDR